MKPRLPKVDWPNLICHIPSMVFYWTIYILVAYMVLSFGHGFVVEMLFENIPEVQITAGIIIAVAVLAALLVVWSQFVANKKDEFNKAKKAKMEGTVYDEVNGEISQKLFWGYPVFAVITAGILAAVVLLVLNELAVTTVCPEFFDSQVKLTLEGIVAELVLFGLVDRFYLRSAMDGVFFEKVEKPATESFLKGVAPVVEGAVEKVKKSADELLQDLLDAGLTMEQALARMKELQ